MFKGLPFIPPPNVLQLVCWNKDPIKTTCRQENEVVEESVDMEHISLHRYIRNTASDTEVHAEHQLRVDRSAWTVEKNV